MSKHLDSPDDKLINYENGKAVMLNTLKYQIYIVSPEYDFIWANQAFETATGLPLSELKGKKCYQVLHQSGKPPEMCLLRQMLRDGNFRLMETELEQNGKILKVSATPVLDNEGHLEKVIHILTDVTEHKNAIEDLNESEEKLETVFDNAVDGILIADTKTRKFLTGNKSICQMLGYNLSEIKELGVMDIHPPKDVFYVAEQFQRQSQGEFTLAKDIPVRRKDGSVFYADINSSTVVISGQTHLLGIFRDVTERRQTEELLKKTQSQLTATLNALPDLLFEVDSAGRIYDFRAPVMNLLYSTPEKFLGKKVSDILPPKANQIIIEAIAEADKVGKHSGAIYSLQLPDGLNWFELSIAVKSEKATPRHFIALVRDITSRKQAENALQLNLTRLAEAEKTAKIGNWEANLITNELYWSEVIFDIFGFKSESFKPNVKAFYEAVHPDDREIVLKSEQLSEQTGLHDVVHRIIRPDGEIRFVHEMAKRYADGNGNLIMLRGTVQDITERKRSEEALQESEEKFRGLAEQSPNMIFINSRGRIIYANKKCEEIMGYTRKEFYSDKFDFMSLIAPDSKAFIKENMKKHSKGKEIPPYEYRLVTKDGKEIIGIHTTKLIDIKGDKAVLGIITDITEQVKSREQIKAQALALEQKNMALREVLSQITVEKAELENRMHQNLDKLVMPRIKRLKSRAENDLKDQLGVIESAIKGITSAFGKKISSSQRALSSREIEVCDMIRSGLRNKAIARSLRLSLETIETMRKTIRRKLKIQNKQVNLKTYLQTM